LVYSPDVADERNIPNRSVYKASEVCEIARIQPYVLRSWEGEFSNLGVPRTSGGRVYRRADVEQVLRIKQLVFEEGLTLAGARRRLEEERAPQPDLPLEELMTPDVRARIGRVRQGLQDLLGMLGGRSPLRAVERGDDNGGEAPALGVADATEATAPAPAPDSEPGILDLDDSSNG
jgi:DNA-binding transcriptional MerR regulator